MTPDNKEEGRKYLLVQFEGGKTLVRVLHLKHPLAHPADERELREQCQF